jgi:putative alpha-1,2-mannosidase
MTWLHLLPLAVQNPEKYANVLGGTQSKYDMSHGNVLPESQLPWAFNGWAPQTNGAQSSNPNAQSSNKWWFSSEVRSARESNSQSP